MLRDRCHFFFFLGAVCRFKSGWWRCVKWEALCENLLLFSPCPGIPTSAAITSSSSSFIALHMLVLIYDNLFSLSYPYLAWRHVGPHTLCILPSPAPCDTTANVEQVLRPSDFCPLDVLFIVGMTATYKVMTSQGRRKNAQSMACCGSPRKQLTWLGCAIFQKALEDAVSALAGVGRDNLA